MFIVAILKILVQIESWTFDQAKNLIKFIFFQMSNEFKNHSNNRMQYEV